MDRFYQQHAPPQEDFETKFGYACKNERPSSIDESVLNLVASLAAPCLESEKLAFSYLDEDNHRRLH